MKKFLIYAITTVIFVLNCIFLTGCDVIYPTITYDYNGGTNVEGDEDSMKEDFTDFTDSITTFEPVKEGYYFCGWSKESYDSYACYFPGLTYSFYDDRTLYAVWNPVENVEYYDQVFANTIKENEYNVDVSITFTKEMVFKDMTVSIDGTINRNIKGEYTGDVLLDIPKNEMDCNFRAWLEDSELGLKYSILETKKGKYKTLLMPFNMGEIGPYGIVRPMDLNIKKRAVKKDNSIVIDIPGLEAKEAYRDILGFFETEDNFDELKLNNMIVYNSRMEISIQNDKISALNVDFPLETKGGDIDLNFYVKIN